MRRQAVLTCMVLALTVLAGCGNAVTQRRGVHAARGATEAVLTAELEERAATYMKSLTRNPYTAKVHSCRAERLAEGTRFGWGRVGEGDQTYAVQVQMEAVNGFGAFIVSEYLLWIRYDPEDHVWEMYEWPVELR